MKLIEALEVLKQNPPAQSATLNLRLACGFTPLHFLPFFSAHLRREFPNHQVTVETGLFGDLAGNLDRLEGERQSAIAVVIEWSDFDPRLGIRRLGGWGPTQLADLLASARNQAAQLSALLEKVTVLEEEFGVQFEVDELEHLVSFSSILDYLKKLPAAQAHDP